jgi:spermidine/putrescine transport system ATP-binding protein
MSEGSKLGSLKLRSVRKAFGRIRAVDGVDLDIAGGEFVAFLGPSGCGKTTLLRIIAGFETLDSGTLELDGRDVAALPPNRRDVGLVFQNLALFPHLSVAENVGYGLRMRGRPAAEITAKVAAMLDLVDLAQYGERRIPQLSGGQKQRVALARALVLKPSVLLLDEPLSALDAKLRRQLQVELKSLQREMATTFIFVTHDQEEALSMADRVAVFNQGRIEQFGDPEALYGRPASRFVAEFVGDANLRSGAELAPFGVDVPAGDLLVVRPEHCAVGDAVSAKPVQRSAVVETREFVGPHARLRLKVEGSDMPWLVLCPGAEAQGLTIGSTTRFGFDPAASARVKA